MRQASWSFLLCYEAFGGAYGARCLHTYSVGSQNGEFSHKFGFKTF